MGLPSIPSYLITATIAAPALVELGIPTIVSDMIDKGVMNYTVGIGYRFTPNFYTDLACVFRTHKEDVYAFSNMFAGDDPKPFLEAQPATMKTNTTRVALTLGYKF